LFEESFQRSPWGKALGEIIEKYRASIEHHADVSLCITELPVRHMRMPGSEMIYSC